MFSVPGRTSRQAAFGLPRGYRVTARAYDRAILATPGLTHYWPFRNGSMADVVGSLPFVIAAPVVTATALAQSLGTAMDNTGNGSMKTVPNYTWPSPMSMECWVNTPNTTTEGGVMGAWGGAVGSMLIIFSGSNQLRFYTNGSANVVQTLSINTLYHIVATHDGTDQRVYVNGALVLGPTAGTAPSGASVPFELGNYANHGGGGMNGKYSNAATYNRDLTLAEVLAHYTAGTS